MNRWLDFTEQILRKVHWTCTCAQSQGPNLRGGAKYAKYAGDGRWAWCKTKYAKQLFVNTLLAGYWLVRWKKKTSCWQIPFWLCAPSSLPIWVDQYICASFTYSLNSSSCHIIDTFAVCWYSEEIERFAEICILWKLWEPQIRRSDLHQFTFLGSTLKAPLNGAFHN